MKIKCDSFLDFVEKFQLIFKETGCQIVLAPVRTGKTYQCEKYISDVILHEKKK
jgi:hypothetical protein